MTRQNAPQLRQDEAETVQARRRVIFSVPLPPAALWPNARPHWTEKARAVKAYRSEVGVCILAAFQRGAMPHFARAVLSLEYAFSTFRHRDEDNLRAAFKAGQDALVDAQIVPDDTTAHLTIGHVGWHVTAKGEQPGVTVTVEEAT